jgi:hypothetical protein
MSKLYKAVEKAYQKGRRTNGSKNMNRRLFDSLDMAIIKHDEAIHNAQLKRGEIEKGVKHMIYACGCNSSGCCLHIEVK